MFPSNVPFVFFLCVCAHLALFISWVTAVALQTLPVGFLGLLSLNKFEVKILIEETLYIQEKMQIQNNLGLGNRKKENGP